MRHAPSPATTTVRMTTLRSALPLQARKPSAPEYTPRGPLSRHSRICIVRCFGAPVMLPAESTDVCHFFVWRVEKEKRRGRVGGEGGKEKQQGKTEVPH